VTTALIYLVVMVLVAAVVFLLVSAIFGRGEELAPLPPGASPTRLPASDITSEDVRALKFQLVLRGYRMSEVDWVLNRLAGEVDELRTRIAELERALDERAGDESVVPATAAEHNHRPNHRVQHHRPQPSHTENAT
jgi:DivIVA domain-containing protein